MRRGITRRVLTVVTVVTTALVAGAVSLGAVAVSRVRAELVVERTRLATAVAAETERLLGAELEHLATVAVAADDDIGELSQRLRAAYHDSRLLDVAFVAARGASPAADAQPQGRAPGAHPPVRPYVVLIEPSTSALPRALVDEAARVAQSGRPVVRALPGGGALFALPARSRADAIIGVVGGLTGAAPAELTRLLARVTPGPNGWILLRDADGALVVRSGASGDARDMVVGAAPVGPLGWTVSVGQPAADALGSALSVQRWLLVAAPLVLGVTLLLTWGATRSVVRPIQELTKAAETIAGGNLDVAVPPGRGDEAGRLARAFDEMRRALKSSVRRALLEKTLAAQEDERRRISRELHDETSQTVNALLMKLDAALAAHTPAIERRDVVQVRELAVRLLDGVHRLILALRPSLLDDLGLFAAIEWFARDQLAPLGVTVHFEADDPDVRLPRDVELALFRVAQETITNIARHARADTALIECAVSPEGITIDVEDDGEGFDPSSLASDPTSMRGLGLAGMQERVALVGGRLTIESSPGGGTHVRIVVPLPKEALIHV